MKNILLVEDSPIVRESLASVLKARFADCSIIKAENGYEGVEILRRLRVDMIVTDLSMPVMDGFELIEHKNRNFPWVPTVAMTANASPDVVERLHALGVDELLQKPFDLDAIESLITKNLAKRSEISLPNLLLKISSLPEFGGKGFSCPAS